MFDELKRAWTDAVRNFRRELHGGGASAPDEPASGGESAARALASARRVLAAVQAELDRSRQRLAAERGEADACRRRGELARRIDDDETARIADHFAARHAEWADVLERKVDALGAESTLLVREIRELESVLSASRAAYGSGGPAAADPSVDPLEASIDPLADPVEVAFRDLEEEARHRAAEERASDLRRKS